MADTTTVGTQGFFGTVTDRIVAIGTQGFFDELVALVAALYVARLMRDKHSAVELSPKHKAYPLRDKYKAGEIT